MIVPPPVPSGTIEPAPRVVIFTQLSIPVVEYSKVIELTSVISERCACSNPLKLLALLAKAYSSDITGRVPTCVKVISGPVTSLKITVVTVASLLPRAS